MLTEMAVSGVASMTGILSDSSVFAILEAIGPFPIRSVRSFK
jgi:hypothetical protein